MKRNETKKIITILFFLCLYYLLFTSNTLGLYLDKVSMIFFLILTFLSTYALFSYSEEFIEKYTKKKNWIFILLIAMLMAFIIAGQPLFLNSVRIYITLKKLLVYFLLVLWCIPVELYLLSLLEQTSLKIKEKRESKKNVKKRVEEIEKQKKKVFWMTFLILTTVWTIVFIGMFPGTITSDSIDQYLQALGQWNLNNAHPVLMTLMIRATTIISKNPAFFIYLQILFFAFLISFILTFLYKKGLSKKAIYIFSFLFAILPSSYLLIVSLWKDVIYTIALLWMTYLLFRLCLNEKEFFQKKINSIAFVVATMLVAFFRHNGIGPFLFVLIYFIYLTFKKRKKSYVILTLSLVICYVGFSQMISVLCPPKPSKTEYSNLTNLVTRSSGQILQTSTLPEYTEKIVTNYASLDLLKSEYNPYNVDSYGFNDKISAHQSTLENPTITTGEAIHAYLLNFIYYPMDTIKERLDGTDILWNMKQPYNSFNHRYGTGIWLPANLSEEDLTILQENLSKNIGDEEAYIPKNKIYDLSTSFAYKLGNFFIFDNIISRGGIYLICLLILTLFLFKNNRKLFPMYLPILGNTATWIVLLAFQAYRYIWYIQVITIFMILFVMVCGKKGRDIE